MNIHELYDLLRNPDFLKAGNEMFYNYYVYHYPASTEYSIRETLDAYAEDLKEPEPEMDVLKLNVFDAFCEYLRSQKFGSKFPNMLEYLRDKDHQDPDAVTDILTNAAEDDEFMQLIQQKIQQHWANHNGYRKCYVFLYGFGQMFPYMRTNTFLTKYEPYNSPDDYKFIIFYPGEVDGETFQLFGLLRDAHTYRATLLIN